jgi:hypothetical protein
MVLRSGLHSPCIARSASSRKREVVDLPYRLGPRGGPRMSRWGSRRRKLRVSCLICRISVCSHSLGVGDHSGHTAYPTSNCPSAHSFPTDALRSFSFPHQSLLLLSQSFRFWSASSSPHPQDLLLREEGKGRMRMRRGIGEKTRRRSGCKGWTSRTGRRNEVY